VYSSEEISQTLMQSESAFALHSMSAEMWGQDTGQGSTPGQSFGAGATSAVTGMAVPAAGFGMMMGSWALQSKMGFDPMFGAAKLGARAGGGLASSLGAGTIGRGIGKVGLGAVGLGVGMLPGIMAEQAVSYVGNQMFQGAYQQFGTERFMTQMSGLADPFGDQSIMSAGFGGAGSGSDGLSDWVRETGASAFEGIGKQTGMGFRGAMSLGGTMASAGMLGDFNNPTEFLDKFREKLKQVEKVASALDSSLTEAASVMSRLQGLGVSSAGQESLGVRLGNVSSMTGLSVANVMGMGAAGAQEATQLGLSADAGFELGVSNLSSITTMSNLGAIDQGLLNRAGGAQGLASAMTSLSLRMPSTRGGYDLMRRMVNEEGTGFDFERMSDMTAGGRRHSRRRVDPYAMQELSENFQEREASVVLGQVQRIQSRYGDDQERANREQYRFLSNMGIEDPQMQQAYLQNLRAQPTMAVLESAQQIRDDQVSSAERRNDARNVFSRFFDKLGRDLDDAVGEPLRDFGRNMAQTFSQWGESISEWAVGSEQTGGPNINITAGSVSRYTNRILSGDLTPSATRSDVLNMLQSDPQLFGQEDQRGAVGRFFGEDDTRFAQQMLTMVNQGWLSADTVSSQGGPGMINMTGGQGIGAGTPGIFSAGISLVTGGVGTIASAMLGEEDQGEQVYTTPEGYYRARAAAGGVFLDENLDVVSPDEDLMGRFRRRMGNDGFRQGLESALDDDDLSAEQARITVGRRLGMNVGRGQEMSARQLATINAAMGEMNLSEDQRAQFGLQERQYETVHELHAELAAETLSLRIGRAAGGDQDQVALMLESEDARSAFATAEMAGLAQSMRGGQSALERGRVMGAGSAWSALSEEQREDVSRARRSSRDAVLMRNEYQGEEGWRQTLGDRDDWGVYGESMMTEEQMTRQMQNEMPGFDISDPGSDEFRRAAQRMGYASVRMDRAESGGAGTRMYIQTPGRTSFRQTGGAENLLETAQETLEGVAGRGLSAERTAELMLFSGFSPFEEEHLAAIDEATGGDSVSQEMRRLQRRHAAGMDGDEGYEEILSGIWTDVSSAVSGLDEGEAALIGVSRTGGRQGFTELIQMAEDTTIAAARAADFARRSEAMRATMAEEFGPEVLTEAGQREYYAAIGREATPAEAMQAVLDAEQEDPRGQYWIDDASSIRATFIALSQAGTGRLIGQDQVTALADEQGAALQRAVNQTEEGTQERADAETALASWTARDEATGMTGRESYEAGLQERRGGELSLGGSLAALGRQVAEGGFTQQEMRTVELLLGPGEGSANLIGIMAGSEEGGTRGRQRVQEGLRGIWEGEMINELAKDLDIRPTGDTAEERRQNAAEQISEMLQGDRGDPAQRRARQTVMERAMASGLLDGSALENQQDARREDESRDAMIRMQELMASVVDNGVMRVSTGIDPASPTPRTDAPPAEEA